MSNHILVLFNGDYINTGAYIIGFIPMIKANMPRFLSILSNAIGEHAFMIIDEHRAEQLPAYRVEYNVYKAMMKYYGREVL